MGATFGGEILTLLKGYLKKPLVKMKGCHFEGLIGKNFER